MSNESKQPEPEITDHSEIRKSLNRLDRSTSWFWWNTIVVIVLLVAALVAIDPAELVARFALLHQLDLTGIVRGLLALMLVGNLYTLYHQRHLKRFRKRLADQMQAAVKQRTRADKFYGLAILDPLTGLYNRRFGEECLAKEITRAEKNDTPLAVIALDLDYFKEVNDQFGHAAGDLVLKEFSRHLRRAIRACDVPVRMGGDEFLVVLPECPRENVQIILSRLKTFELRLGRNKIPVSFSRGRAQYQVCDTVQTLIERADKTLYDEKAARPTNDKSSAGADESSLPQAREGNLLESSSIETYEVVHTFEMPVRKTTSD
jgi:diguanylate cyclase (GGDEF)-like protein